MLVSFLFFVQGQMAVWEQEAFRFVDFNTLKVTQLLRNTAGDFDVDVDIDNGNANANANANGSGTKTVKKENTAPLKTMSR